MRFLTLFLKSLLKGVLALALTAALIPVLLIAFLQFPYGQKTTADLISKYASGPHQSITLDRLFISLNTSQIVVNEVELGDRDGIWLRADTLALNWSPTALFDRTIKLDSIEADQIAVLRSPEIPQDPATQEPDPADQANDVGLPFGLGVDLETLTIQTLDLGPAIAGQDVSFTVESSANLTPKPLALSGSLKLTRADGIDGLISAKAKFDPAQQILAFDLNVHEPKGGLVATLANMEGLPALDVKLAGDGPLEAWAADLQIALDQRETARGSAKIEQAETGYNLGFDLNGELEPLFPPALSAFVLGTTRATANLDFDKAFTPLHGTLQINSQTVTLSGSGSHHADTNSFQVETDLGVSAGDNALIALELEDQSITFGPLSLSAKAEGLLDNFSWNVSLTTSQLLSQQASIASSKLTARGEGSSIQDGALTSPYGFKAQITGASSPNLVLPQFDGHIELAANGAINTAQSTFQANSAKLLTNLAVFDVSKASYTPEKAILSGTVQLSSLASFADLTMPGLSGSIAGAFEVSANPADQLAEITLSAKANTLKSGIAELDKLLGRTTNLSAAVSFTSPETLALKSVTLTADGLTLSANGRIAGDQINASTSISLPDLARLSPDINGPLEANAVLSGSLSEPDIQLSSNSEQIFMAGTPLRDLKLTGTAHASPTAPTGVFEVTAQLGDLPLSIEAEAEQSGKKTNVRPLKARLGTNRMEGSFSIDDPARALETLSGQLTLDLPKLAELSPLALTQLEGSLTGSMTAGTSSGEQKITLTLNGADLEVESNKISKLQMDASISSPFEPVGMSANVLATDLFLGSQAIHTVSLSASPGETTLPISAKIQLFADSKDDGLSANANLIQLDQGIQLDLSHFEGSYDGLSTKLLEDASITQVGNETTLSPIRLSIGSGELVISGKVSDQIDLNTKLTNIPLALANAFAPSLGLKGTISGVASASGNPESPKANWSISGTNLTANEVKNNGLSAFSLSSNGTFANQTIQQNTSVTNLDGLSITANGDVSLSAQSLSVAVSGTVPMESLRRPLTQAGFAASGQLGLSGSVSGPITSPQYSLDVRPSALTFTDLASGTRLEDFRGDIAVSPAGIALNSITATIAAGGALSASGTVGLSDNMPADIKASIKDGRFVDPGLVSATLNTEVSIKGPLGSAVSSALVAGNILINRADITIPENLSGAVSPIAVKHVNAPKSVQRQIADLGGDKPAKNTQSRAAAPPRVDIGVSAPGRIFVRGRGLDAELQGNLKVAGTTLDPQAIGSFDLRRGQLDILTRRMKFSSGSATFAGSFTPVIDFIATTTVANTLITVRVAGNASDPQITFSSSPELPQDEVLSLLLFGKSMGNLSPIQIAQLAAAIQTLTGGSDNGPLAQIRKSLGLDAIDINTDANGETSVSVGKYINENIYLGVEQGTGSNSSRVQVDIDLDRGLKLRGEVGADGSSKAGIFFEKEY